MDLQVTSDAAAAAQRFRRAAAALRDLRPVNERAGAIVKAAPAPHRLGQLGATVRADATATDVTVAGTTSYWTYVHWGAPRIHVRAQPWLLAAVEADDQEILDLYRDHATTSVALAGD